MLGHFNRASTESGQLPSYTSFPELCMVPPTGHDPNPVNHLRPGPRGSSLPCARATNKLPHRCITKCSQPDRDGNTWHEADEACVCYHLALEHKATETNGAAKDGLLPCQLQDWLRADRTHRASDQSDNPEPFWACGKADDANHVNHADHADHANHASHANHRGRRVPLLPRGKKCYTSRNPPLRFEGPGALM